MRQYLKERTLETANFMLEKHTTIRQTAKIFGMSKSTLHYDLSTRLKKIDLKLYEKIKEILEENFAEKHIRGGEATRKKYAKTSKINTA